MQKNIISNMKSTNDFQEKICFFLLVPIILLSCNRSPVAKEFMLQDNWQFRNTAEGEWLPAAVPGCVHTDLLANGKIEDPFYRLNEHGQQWIDKTDWEYLCIFKIPGEVLKMDVVEIFFRGLDTYADVYLNDGLILRADNMFREWKADIRENLVAGDNELRIYFHSPVKLGLEKLGQLDYEFPAPPNDLSEIGGIGDNKVSIFTRKAGYHFGWDWGPRFVTSGIWKEVIIRAWDRARIEDLFVQQDEISEEKAVLTAILDIRSSKADSLKLRGTVNGAEIISSDLKLSAGTNRVRETFTIENPELWWPNGLGDQPMYDISFSLSDRASVISQKGIRTGLRTIEIVQDADDKGETFYFNS